MSKVVEELDLGFCESCDSWVTVVEIAGDNICKSELDMYGYDLATVVD